MIKLSVIIPVYNEFKTFPVLLDKLLNFKLDGVIFEFIIVESNSNDGTREYITTLSNSDKLKIIFEDNPKGKGHAVRTGLNYATGDIILIQDADLEYDINDYPNLLQPIISGETSFVLGSRHSETRRSWKIRKFTEGGFLQFYMNLGHLFFLTLFNFTYQQKLKDPFTMFKVFKSECIKNLNFEANGFDFDWELVAKLIRSGCQPIEIPVNYNSRSFKEGKKTRLFSDPVSWIWACFKYRFCSLKPKNKRSNSQFKK